MSTDALREQIRAQVRTALQRQQTAMPVATSPKTPAAHAVVVPLRLSHASDTQALTQLFQRLAASPALLHAATTGLLRFDLRVDEGAIKAVAVAPASHEVPGTSAMAATTAIDPAACCSSCKQGKACECKGDTCDLHAHPAENVPELKGVIGEKLLKTLPPSVKTVRLHPKAVMTPLGKEALRKRGITIDRGATP